MLKFQRYTHTEDGKYRFSQEDDLTLTTNIQHAKCSIHMLDSKKWMTFEEIVKEHFRYDNEYILEPFGYTETEIFCGLGKLIEAGIVKTKYN